MKRIFVLSITIISVLFLSRPVYAATGISETLGNTTHYDFGGGLTGMSERIGNTIHYTFGDGTSGMIEITDDNTFHYDLGGGQSGISSTVGNTTHYNFSDGLTGTSERLGNTIHYNFSDGTGGIGEITGNTIHYNFSEPVPSTSIPYDNTVKTGFELNVPTFDTSNVMVNPIQTTKPTLNIQKIETPGYDACYAKLLSECSAYLSYFNERAQANRYYKGDTGDETLKCTEARMAANPDGIWVNEMSRCNSAVMNDFYAARYNACEDALNKCYEDKTKTFFECPAGATFNSINNTCKCNIGLVANADGSLCITYAEAEMNTKKCPTNATYNETMKQCYCDEGYALYRPKNSCVEVPENAHAVETQEDAWLCNEGYHEENGKCVKEEIDIKQAALRAIIAQELSAESDIDKTAEQMDIEPEVTTTIKETENRTLIITIITIISIIIIGGLSYAILKRHHK